MRAFWSIVVGLGLAGCGAVVGWMAYGPLMAVLLYVVGGMIGVLASVAVVAIRTRHRHSLTTDQDEPSQGCAPDGRVIGQNS